MDHSFWQSLKLRLQTTASVLENIDVHKEMLPRSKLAPAITAAQRSLKQLRENNISMLGRVPITREVGFVCTTLLSIDSTLSEDQLSPADFDRYRNNCVAKLKTLLMEVGVQADVHVPAAKEKPVTDDPVMLQTLNELNVHNEVRAAKSFDSFSEAMSHALRIAEQRENRMEKSREAPPRVDQTNIKLVREQHLFSDIADTSKRTLQLIRQRLNETKNAAVIFVKAPVVVISEKPISMHNLRTAGVDHKVINFPGIQFGVNPGGRHEANPYAVMLEKQLLAVLPQRREPSLDAVFEEAETPLTRDYLPGILKMRTGTAYVDVLKDEDTMIASKALPGYKMIWLMPASMFVKLGSLNIREVGLPFA